MKRLLFLSLLVLGLFLAACGSTSLQEKSQPGGGTPTPTIPPVTQQEQPETRFYRVGEVVTIPNVMQITVTRVQHVPFSQSEPDVSPEGGWPKNGELLALSVTMTNLGKTPLSVTGFDYGLRDAEGNTPYMWIWKVQGIDRMPTGTAPHAQKIKGDVMFITDKGTHPYYFSFSGGMPMPLFWQID